MEPKEPTCLYISLLDKHKQLFDDNAKVEERITQDESRNAQTKILRNKSPDFQRVMKVPINLVTLLAREGGGGVYPRNLMIRPLFH